MRAQNLAGRCAAARGPAEAPGAARFLRGDEVDRAVHAHREDIIRGIEIGIGLPALDVRTVFADARENGIAGRWVLAHLARQGKQRERLFQREGFQRHALGERGALRLLALAELDEGPEAAFARRDFKARLRVLPEHAVAVVIRAFGAALLAARHGEGAGEAAFRIVRAADEGPELAELQGKLARTAFRAGPRIGAIALVAEDRRAEMVIEAVEHFRRAALPGTLDRGLEILPELAEHLAPIDLGIGDAVKIVLEIGGEPEFDIAREEAFEESRDDAALVLGEETLLVDLDVFAVAQGCERRGIGGGAADAQLFHPLDERGFRESRRRLGEMLGRGDGLFRNRIPHLHGRQALRILILGVFVGFLIEREKTIEEHDLAGRAQVELAGAGFGENVDRGALEARALHLACEGAFPDEFVEPVFVAREIGLHGRRNAEDIRGADGLVGFLRVLRLGGIGARNAGQVFRLEFPADEAAQGGHRLRGHVDAVGAHIGDEAGRLAADLHPLIEFLRKTHGDGRRETELARGFHLQRRSGEGRIGMALRGLGFHGLHREARRIERRLEGLGLGLRADIEPGDLPAIRADKPRLEGLAPGGEKRRHQRPVFPRDEALDLLLAIADEAQGDRLHAACRTRARQFPPEHGRKLEAHEVIQRASSQIGIDQRLVDLARVRHGMGHGILGDGVEGHALHRLALEHAARFQRFENVPRDGLALAIRVGRENEAVRILHGGGDGGDLL